MAPPFLANRRHGAVARVDAAVVAEREEDVPHRAQQRIVVAASTPLARRSETCKGGRCTTL